jgi:hypothetical protein
MKLLQTNPFTFCLKMGITEIEVRKVPKYLSNLP